MRILVLLSSLLLILPSIGQTDDSPTIVDNPFKVEIKTLSSPLEGGEPLEFSFLIIAPPAIQKIIPRDTYSEPIVLPALIDSKQPRILPSSYILLYVSNGTSYYTRKGNDMPIVRYTEELKSPQKVEIRAIYPVSPSLKSERFQSKEGKIPLWVSEEKQQTHPILLTIEKSAELNTGEFVCRVEKFGESTHYSELQEITFEINGKNCECIDSLIFTDENGQPIKTCRSQYTYGSSSSTKQYFTYLFEQQPAKLNISISQWINPKEISVPIKLGKVEITNFTTHSH